MDVTYLQIFGLIFAWFGGYCFVKGRIEWSIEFGPGPGRKNNLFNIDLTPEHRKTRKEGELTGKWVRPVCLVIMLVGIAMIAMRGESVAFSF